MDSAAVRPPRLIGIGVGPGDPGLVTIQAVQALESADVIFVPTTETRSARAGRAEEIVLEHLPHKADAVRRIPFAMAERQGVGQKRSAAWDASVTAAVEALDCGAQTVAFATIGDPSVFSTFSYLCDLVTQARPGVELQVIPGITAMQALAARSRTPLVEGQEILALVPATVGWEKIAEVARTVDTVVIYKGGRQLTELKKTLAAGNRLGDAVLGTNIGLEAEEVVKLAEVDDDRAPYFSTVLSPAHRSQTGGRL